MLSAPAAENGTKRNAESGPQRNARCCLIERCPDRCADADSDSNAKAQFHAQPVGLLAQVLSLVSSGEQQQFVASFGSTHLARRFSPSQFYKTLIESGVGRVVDGGPVGKLTFVEGIEHIAIGRYSPHQAYWTCMSPI